MAPSENGRGDNATAASFNPIRGDFCEFYIDRISGDAGKILHKRRQRRVPVALITLRGGIPSRQLLSTGHVRMKTVQNFQHARQQQMQSTDQQVAHELRHLSEHRFF